MIFFSVYIRLNSEPDFLIHNVSNSVHTGDFVLPMFLFAGGISSVLFIQKRRSWSLGKFLFDLIERVGKLLLVAMFITPFSVGEIFHIDELMLYIVLFVVSLPLVIW